MAERLTGYICGLTGHVQASRSGISSLRAAVKWVDYGTRRMTSRRLEGCRAESIKLR